MSCFAIAIRVSILTYRRGALRTLTVCATARSLLSCRLNHLLKSPFVVHPSTGNVCVPINPATIEQFDLARVPKLATIMAQLDAGTATDMDAAVQDFRRLFLQPLDAAIRAERIALKQQEQWKAEPMEF